MKYQVFQICHQFLTQNVKYLITSAEKH